MLSKNCNPPEKGHPNLSHQPPSTNWHSVKAPPPLNLFENLLEVLPFLSPSRKGGGAHHGCQGHLNYFLENHCFCRKSGNDAYSRRCGVMLFASLWSIAYENRYLTHPLRKLILRQKKRVLNYWNFNVLLLYGQFFCCKRISFLIVKTMFQSPFATPSSNIVGYCKKVMKTPV